MSNQGQFRWIVLINKSPRGPLSEVEVRALLAQGVVRHNDLAYRIDVDKPEEKAEWKLLWQFPEFDRRSPENFTKKKTPPPVEKEQRAAPPDEKELREKARSELPEDLVDIAPEDLLPRARAVPAEDSRWVEKWAETSADSAESKPSVGWSFQPPLWAYGLVAVVALSYGVMRLVNRRFSAPKFELPSTSGGNANIFVPPAENRGTASSPVQPPSNRGTVITAPSHPVPNLSPPSALPIGRDEIPADRELDRERDKEREQELKAEEEERAKEERAIDDEEKRESPAPRSSPSEENGEREERPIDQ